MRGVRLTVSDMKRRAKKRRWKFLSRTYRGSNVKHRWECGRGHRFWMTPRGEQRGSGCHTCVRMAKTHTVAEMKRRARKRGGKFRSKKYRGSRVKHRWECRRGHVFSMTPANQHQGSWCPTCAFRRYRLTELRTLARERGFTLLSTVYTNSRTRMRWRCAEGHCWWATAGNVKAGSGCPKCSVPGPKKGSSRRGRPRRKK